MIRTLKVVAPDVAGKLRTPDMFIVFWMNYKKGLRTHAREDGIMINCKM